MRPLLLCRVGDDAGLALAVGERPLLVGRARDCDLALSDEAASRRHLRVSLRGERLIAEDLESAQGTLVNGTRLAPGEPASLSDGDIVRVASTEFDVIDLDRVSRRTVVAACLLGPGDFRVPLRPGDNVIGSSHDADLVVEDADVAPRHGNLVLDASSCRVLPLVRTPPVLVNGESTDEEAELTSGDVLQFSVGAVFGIEIHRGTSMAAPATAPPPVAPSPPPPAPAPVPEPEPPTVAPPEPVPPAFDPLADEGDPLPEGLPAGEPEPLQAAALDADGDPFEEPPAAMQPAPDADDAQTQRIRVRPLESQRPPATPRDPPKVTPPAASANPVAAPPPPPPAVPDADDARTQRIRVPRPEAAAPPADGAAAQPAAAAARPATPDGAVGDGTIPFLVRPVEPRPAPAPPPAAPAPEPPRSAWPSPHPPAAPTPLILDEDEDLETHDRTAVSPAERPTESTKTVQLDDIRAALEKAKARHAAELARGDIHIDTDGRSARTPSPRELPPLRPAAPADLRAARREAAVRMHVAVPRQPELTVLLREGRHLLGQGDRCRVRVVAPSIQLEHAEIGVGPEGVHVRALTPDGLILRDGRRLSDSNVDIGERLRFGDIEAWFESI